MIFLFSLSILIYCHSINCFLVFQEDWDENSCTNDPECSLTLHNDSTVVNEDGNHFLHLENQNKEFSYGVIDGTLFRRSFPSPGKEFSIAAWIRVKDPQTLLQDARFVCNQEPAGRYNLQFSLVNCASCAFRNAAAIRARARFGSGQGNYYDSHGEHMIFPFRWTHVIATYDNSSFTLYYDTMETGQTDTSKRQYRWSPPVGLTLGGCAKSSGEDRGFTGDIDDFRLYNHALSEAERARVYAGLPSDMPVDVLLQLDPLQRYPSHVSAFDDDDDEVRLVVARSPRVNITQSLSRAAAWLRGDPCVQCRELQLPSGDPARPDSLLDDGDVYVLVASRLDTQHPLRNTMYASLYYTADLPSPPLADDDDVYLITRAGGYLGAPIGFSYRSSGYSAHRSFIPDTGSVFGGHRWRAALKIPKAHNATRLDFAVYELTVNPYPPNTSYATNPPFYLYKHFLTTTTTTTTTATSTSTTLPPTTTSPKPMSAPTVVSSNTNSLIFVVITLCIIVVLLLIGMAVLAWCVLKLKNASSENNSVAIANQQPYNTTAEMQSFTDTAHASTYDANSMTNNTYDTTHAMPGSTYDTAPGNQNSAPYGVLPTTSPAVQPSQYSDLVFQ